MSSQIFVKTRF